MSNLNLKYKIQKLCSKSLIVPQKHIKLLKYIEKIYMM